MSKRTRSESGFTMVEALIAMTLIAFCIALSYGMVNYKDRTRDNIVADYTNKAVEMEKAFNAYYADKNAYPDCVANALTDATFVPAYLFPPQATKGGFDSAYATNGFWIGVKTGAAVNNNGYYISTKYDASGPADNTYLAIKQIATVLSPNKFFYNVAAAGAATANMADPAGAVAVYTTYWFSRW